MLPAVASAILAALIQLPPGSRDGQYAQEAQASPPPAQTPAKPAKIVPPLFPKHRRGLYLDGEGKWVIDATPQSPPLETDDPGVPEKGEYEINLSSGGDFSQRGKTLDLLRVDANYGLLPTFGHRELPTQLKFEVPLGGAAEAGQPLTTGIGAAQVGVKCNFYNSANNSTGLAFYPQLEFAMGPDAVSRGLADHGQTLTLPLLVSRELKYAVIVLNGALEAPLHDPTRHVLGAFSAGAGTPVTRRLAAMAEIRSESRFDFAHDRLVAANLGLIGAAGHSIMFYGNLGHSLISDDGFRHVYAGFGMKVLIK